MRFEVLIRQANQCGRYGVEGANEDIYRSFERTYNTYMASKAGKPTNSTLSKEQLAFDAGLELGQIVAYVKTAIDKVQRECKHKLSEEAMEKLNKCQSSLMSYNDLTKEVVDKAMEDASEVFRDIGLLA